MESWEDIQPKKVALQNQILATLSKAEQNLLVKTLQSEWDNRHLNHTAVAAEIRKSLKNAISQEFK